MVTYYQFYANERLKYIMKILHIKSLPELIRKAAK